jgi:hypothetical protein
MRHHDRLPTVIAFGWRKRVGVRRAGWEKGRAGPRERSSLSRIMTATAKFQASTRQARRAFLEKRLDLVFIGGYL